MVPTPLRPDSHEMTMVLTLLVFRQRMYDLLAFICLAVRN
jgi:hypothetical protein